MPYVAAAEAPNLCLTDVQEIANNWTDDIQRLPLIGTEQCRVVLWQLHPGMAPHPLHRHPYSDEVMLILRGQGQYIVGDDPEFTAGAGRVVFAGRGVPHTLRAIGKEPLVWVTFVAPNRKGVDEEIVER